MWCGLDGRDVDGVEGQCTCGVDEVRWYGVV